MRKLFFIVFFILSILLISTVLAVDITGCPGTITDANLGQTYVLQNDVDLTSGSTCFNLTGVSGDGNSITLDCNSKTVTGGNSDIFLLTDTNLDTITMTNCTFTIGASYNLFNLVNVAGTSNVNTIDYLNSTYNGARGNLFYASGITDDSLEFNFTGSSLAFSSNSYGFYFDSSILTTLNISDLNATFASGRSLFFTSGTTDLDNINITTVSALPVSNGGKLFDFRADDTYANIQLNNSAISLNNGTFLYSSSSFDDLIINGANLTSVDFLSFIFNLSNFENLQIDANFDSDINIQGSSYFLYLSGTSTDLNVYLNHLNIYVPGYSIFLQNDGDINNVTISGVNILDVDNTLISISADLNNLDLMLDNNTIDLINLMYISDSGIDYPISANFNSLDVNVIGNVFTANSLDKDVIVSDLNIYNLETGYFLNVDGVASDMTFCLDAPLITNTPVLFQVATGSNLDINMCHSDVNISESTGSARIVSNGDANYFGLHDINIFDYPAADPLFTLGSSFNYLYFSFDSTITLNTAALVQLTGLSDSYINVDFGNSNIVMPDVTNYIVSCFSSDINELYVSGTNITGNSGILYFNTCDLNYVDLSFGAFDVNTAQILDLQSVTDDYLNINFNDSQVTVSSSGSGLYIRNTAAINNLIISDLNIVSYAPPGSACNGILCFESSAVDVNNIILDFSETINLGSYYIAKFSNATAGMDIDFNNSSFTCNIPFSGVISDLNIHNIVVNATNFLYLGSANYSNINVFDSNISYDNLINAIADINATNIKFYNNYFVSESLGAAVVKMHSSQTLDNINIDFNTSQSTATNIIDINAYGGNYWSDLWGLGASQLCNDDDFDGFCDATVTVGGTYKNFYDYLALAPENPIIDISDCNGTVITSSVFDKIYMFTQDINTFTDNCFELDTNAIGDITIDCNNHDINLSSDSYSFFLFNDNNIGNITIQNCNFNNNVAYASLGFMRFENATSSTGVINKLNIFDSNYNGYNASTFMKIYQFTANTGDTDFDMNLAGSRFNFDDNSTGFNFYDTDLQTVTISDINIISFTANNPTGDQGSLFTLSNVTTQNLDVEFSDALTFEDGFLLSLISFSNNVFNLELNNSLLTFNGDAKFSKITDKFPSDFVFTEFNVNNVDLTFNSTSDLIYTDANLGKISLTNSTVDVTDGEIINLDSSNFQADLQNLDINLTNTALTNGASFISNNLLDANSINIYGLTSFYNSGVVIWASDINYFTLSYDGLGLFEGYATAIDLSSNIDIDFNNSDVNLQGGTLIATNGNITDLNLVDFDAGNFAELSGDSNITFSSGTVNLDGNRFISVTNSGVNRITLNLMTDPVLVLGDSCLGFEIDGNVSIENLTITQNTSGALFSVIDNSDINLQPSFGGLLTIDSGAFMKITNSDSVYFDIKDNLNVTFSGDANAFVFTDFNGLLQLSDMNISEFDSTGYFFSTAGTSSATDVNFVMTPSDDVIFKNSNLFDSSYSLGNTTFRFTGFNPIFEGTTTAFDLSNAGSNITISGLNISDAGTLTRLFDLGSKTDFNFTIEDSNINLSDDVNFLTVSGYANHTWLYFNIIDSNISNFDIYGIGSIDLNDNFPGVLNPVFLLTGNTNVNRISMDLTGKIDLTNSIGYKDLISLNTTNNLDIDFNLGSANVIVGPTDGLIDLNNSGDVNLRIHDANILIDSSASPRTFMRIDTNEIDVLNISFDNLLLAGLESYLLYQDDYNDDNLTIDFNNSYIYTYSSNDYLLYFDNAKINNLSVLDLNVTSVMPSSGDKQILYFIGTNTDLNNLTVSVSGDTSAGTTKLVEFDSLSDSDINFNITGDSNTQNSSIMGYVLLLTDSNISNLIITSTDFNNSIDNYSYFLYVDNSDVSNVTLNKNGVFVSYNVMNFYEVSKDILNVVVNGVGSDYGLNAVNFLRFDSGDGLENYIGELNITLNDINVTSTLYELNTETNLVDLNYINISSNTSWEFSGIEYKNVDDFLDINFNNTQLFGYNVDFTIRDVDQLNITDLNFDTEWDGLLVPIRSDYGKIFDLRNVDLVNIQSNTALSLELDSPFYIHDGTNTVLNLNNFNVSIAEYSSQHCDYQEEVSGWVMFPIFKLSDMNSVTINDVNITSLRNCGGVATLTDVNNLSLNLGNPVTLSLGSVLRFLGTSGDVVIDLNNNDYDISNRYASFMKFYNANVDSVTINNSNINILDTNKAVVWMMGTSDIGVLNSIFDSMLPNDTNIDGTGSLIKLDTVTSNTSVDLQMATKNVTLLNNSHLLELNDSDVANVDINIGDLLATTGSAIFYITGDSDAERISFVSANNSPVDIVNLMDINNAALTGTDFEVTVVDFNSTDPVFKIIDSNVSDLNVMIQGVSDCNVLYYISGDTNVTNLTTHDSNIRFNYLIDTNIPVTGTFYNNYLIDKNIDVNNIILRGGLSASSVDVDFNIAKTLATNIIGGDYIAGNYWTDTDTNGFSDRVDLCGGSDGTGICLYDYNVNLNSLNWVDYLPLTFLGYVDLTVTDISVDNNLVNIETTVSCDINNIGELDTVTDYNVLFYVDDVLIDYNNISSVLTGTSQTTIDFNWTPLDTNHTIMCLVDYAGFDENSDNNSREESFTFYSVDLEVENIRVNSTVAGTTATAYCDINNIGNLDANYDYNISFYVNNVLIDSNLITDDLNVGDSDTINYAWAPSAGTYDLNCVVDYDDYDVDTSNDNYNESITITSAGTNNPGGGGSTSSGSSGGSSSAELTFTITVKDNVLGLNNVSDILATVVANDTTLGNSKLEFSIYLKDKNYLLETKTFNDTNLSNDIYKYSFKDKLNNAQLSNILNYVLAEKKNILPAKIILTTKSETLTKDLNLVLDYLDLAINKLQISTDLEKEILNNSEISVTNKQKVQFILDTNVLGISPLSRSVKLELINKDENRIVYAQSTNVLDSKEITISNKNLIMNKEFDLVLLGLNTENAENFEFVISDDDLNKGNVFAITIKPIFIKTETNIETEFVENAVGFLEIYGKYLLWLLIVLVLIGIAIFYYKYVKEKPKSGLDKWHYHVEKKLPAPVSNTFGKIKSGLEHWQDNVHKKFPEKSQKKVPEGLHDI